MKAQQHPISVEEIEKAYAELRPLLLAFAIRRFRVPEDEAENLVQKIFCDLWAGGRLIGHLRGWLIGAVANSCRGYWRKEGRRILESSDFHGWADPNSEALEDRIQRRLLLEELRDLLPERDATILGWHYLEGWTAPEIASRLKISPAYATLLIHRCLKRARKAYQGDLRSLTSTRRAQSTRPTASGHARGLVGKPP